MRMNEEQLGTIAAAMEKIANELEAVAKAVKDLENTTDKMVDELTMIRYAQE